MNTNPGAEVSGRPAEENSQRRGGNRARSSGRGQERPQRPQPKKFTGREESLGEFVYQHTDGREASDQYSVTTEEIIRYSSTKYVKGADVERSLDDGSKVVFEYPPAAITAGAPEDITASQMIFKMKYNMVLHREELLDSNMVSVYALIKGQCSKAILEKVEGQHGYAAMHKKRDPIVLL